MRVVAEVDVDLGLTRVVWIGTAQDVGAAINPLAVEGQIEGGTAQGLGLALMEEIQTRGGLITNASFTDYLIPTTLDMPPVESVLVEVPEPERAVRRQGRRRAADRRLDRGDRRRAAGRDGPRARARAGPAGRHRRALAVFDHVTIRVADRAASERFYDTVLRPIRDRADPTPTTYAEWDDFSLAVAGPDEPVTSGLHVAFVAPTRADVDEFWQSGPRPVTATTAHPAGARSTARTTTARSSSIRTATASRRCTTAPCGGWDRPSLGSGRGRRRGQGASTRSSRRSPASGSRTTRPPERGSSAAAARSARRRDADQAVPPGVPGRRRRRRRRVPSRRRPRRGTATTAPLASVPNTTTGTTAPSSSTRTATTSRSSTTTATLAAPDPVAAPDVRVRAWVGDVVADHDRVAEEDRERLEVVVRELERRRALHLDVQVRLVRVSRVADEADVLSGHDAVADARARCPASGARRGRTGPRRCRSRRCCPPGARGRCPRPARPAASRSPP